MSQRQSVCVPVSVISMFKVKCFKEVQCLLVPCFLAPPCNLLDCFVTVTLDKDWSNDAENSALITRINYILSYVQIESS